MKFLRAVAELAIEAGARVEPAAPRGRDGFVFEDREVQVEASPTPVGAPAPVSAPVALATGEPASVFRTDVHNIDLHEHRHSSINEAPVEVREVEIPCETRSEHTETLVENRVVSAERAATIETVRELLREATVLRAEHSLERIESVRVAGPTPLATREVERTERILRDVERRHTSSTIRREVEVVGASEARISTEPLVEISIGRIEVRAERKSRARGKDQDAKPSGVMDLQEYLQQRSKGAL